MDWLAGSTYLCQVLAQVRENYYCEMHHRPPLEPAVMDLKICPIVHSSETVAIYHPHLTIHQGPVEGCFVDSRYLCRVLVRVQENYYYCERLRCPHRELLVTDLTICPTGRSSGTVVQVPVQANYYREIQSCPHPEMLVTDLTICRIVHSSETVLAIHHRDFPEYSIQPTVNSLAVTALPATIALLSYPKSTDCPCHSVTTGHHSLPETVNCQDSQKKDLSPNSL